MSGTGGLDSERFVGLREALDKLAGRDHPELAERLSRLLTVVAEEAAVRPRFAQKLSKVLSPSEHLGTGGHRRRDRSRSQRRPAGVFDPFELYKEGEIHLRRNLERLDVAELKNIIAEHGMDRDRLAMKWKTPRRLIGRIVETVAARSTKGDVFRN